MKVFKFDPATGKRGELVADIPRPCATGGAAAGVVLPSNTDTINWWAIKSAEDRQGNPISFPFPVCFCTGEHFASMDRSDGCWWWYALIPQEVAA
jgi:hypothetical protein